MTDTRPIRQFLQMLKSSGVSHLPTVSLPEVVRPALKAGDRKPASTSVSQVASTKAPVSRSNSVNRAAEIPAIQKETAEILARTCDTTGERQEALNDMAAVVSKCVRCKELANSRQQTVFGVGNPDASIMFIGEAPGADEDRQGEPFVGDAGQMLTRIIGACGWKREDLYICNILRCRPPGNRNPLPQEAANCREYLDAQIKIVDPDYIVCWGTVAAQNLLSETRSVGKMRGQFLKHGKAKVMCTYHPSYLLRNESAKKLVWEDMKLFMAEIEADSVG